MMSMKTLADSLIGGLTESKELERVLRERVGASIQVADWVVGEGTDAGGDRAIWVYGLLSDPDTSFEITANVRKEVRAVIQDALGSDAPWVYVRFTDAAEVHG